MQLMLFAFGLFVFVALTIFIFRYTTYLSNVKKGYDVPLDQEDVVSPQ